MNVFFSHKFGDIRVDKAVEIISAICKGMALDHFNVSRASVNAPGNEAQKLIESSDFLIALCTRDHTTGNENVFTLSPAVLQEITIAKALKKPVVCLVEDGVRIDGFLPNMLTYEKVSIDDGGIEKFIYTVTNVVHRTINGIESGKSHFSKPENHKAYYISYVEMLITLKKGERGLFWDYVIERKYVFENDQSEPHICGAWALPLDKNLQSAPLARFEIFGGNKDFHFEQDITYIGNNGIQAQIKFDPPPTKGDFIEFREMYRSPYLNRIFLLGDENASVRVSDIPRFAFDGMCVTNRVEKMTLKIEFPRDYNIKDLTHVVSSFTQTIDTLHKSEIERLSHENCIRLAEFNRKMTARLEITRPFYQNFYGFCWNPPKAETLSMNIWEGQLTFDD